MSNMNRILLNNIEHFLNTFHHFCCFNGMIATPSVRPTTYPFQRSSGCLYCMSAMIGNFSVDVHRLSGHKTSLV